MHTEEDIAISEEDEVALQIAKETTITQIRIDHTTYNWLHLQGKHVIVLRNDLCTAPQCGTSTTSARGSTRDHGHAGLYQVTWHDMQTLANMRIEQRNSQKDNSYYAKCTSGTSLNCA
jgi:hypothetical protein